MADPIGKRKYVLNPKWKQNFVNGLEFENGKAKPVFDWLVAVGEVLYGARTNTFRVSEGKFLELLSWAILFRITVIESDREMPDTVTRKYLPSGLNSAYPCGGKFLINVSE